MSDNLNQSLVSVTGILIDKSMTIQLNAPKGYARPWAVGTLQPNLASTVSHQFGLDPPLSADSITIVSLTNDNLEDTVLFGPNDTHTNTIINQMVASK